MLLRIDGSIGEGGGQVLRTALAFSVLTGREVSIDRIRAGRPKPGLAPQHLTNLLALASLADAEMEGAHAGSTSIVFRPHRSPRGGEHRFDVGRAAGHGSAGSVTLILQTILLPLAASGEGARVRLEGGTHVPWSPPVEFVQQVYLPALEKMGVKAACRLVKRGYYPRGGGAIELSVESGETTAFPPRPIELLERGAFRGIRGAIFAEGLPPHVAARIAERTRLRMKEARLRIEIETSGDDRSGPGAGLFLRADYAGASAGFAAIGARGKPSEAVADEACDQLLAFHAGEATVDRHLADQILLPMALASGSSEMTVEKITGHLLTHAQVIERMIPARIEIEGGLGDPGRVRVEGTSGIGPNEPG